MREGARLSSRARSTSSLNSSSKIARLRTATSRTPAAAKPGAKGFRPAARFRRPSQSSGPGRRNRRTRGSAAWAGERFGARASPHVAPGSRAMAEQPEGRPQPALQMAQALAGVIEHLRVGHDRRTDRRCAETASSSEAMTCRKPVEQILAAASVGRFPDRGRDHQRPQVRTVARFVGADEIRRILHARLPFNLDNSRCSLRPVKLADSSPFHNADGGSSPRRHGEHGERKRRSFKVQWPMFRRSDGRRSRAAMSFSSLILEP